MSDTWGAPCGLLSWLLWIRGALADAFGLAALGTGAHISVELLSLLSFVECVVLVFGALAYVALEWLLSVSRCEGTPLIERGMM